MISSTDQQGCKDIKQLLKNLTPELDHDDYVFCLVNQSLLDKTNKLDYFSLIREQEGITLICTQHQADKLHLDYTIIFSKITIKIHSSLLSVGLTAALSNALKQQNISANMIAGFYHDHVFIPKKQAKKALTTLIKLTLT